MRTLPPTRIVLALLASITLPALADRPLVSETADVIDRGTCQVEAAYGRALTRGAPALRDVGAIFSCGVPLQTQLALGYGHTRGGGVKFESLLMGGKTTLRPPEHGQTGFGVAYSLVGEKSPGSSGKVEEFNLVGLVTAELAKGLLGHANLGWSRSRSARQDTTTWSLGMETTGDLTFAADLFGDDRNRPAASAGAGLVLGGGLSINGAYAVQFDSPRVRLWSIGAKFVF